MFRKALFVLLVAIIAFATISASPIIPGAQGDGCSNSQEVRVPGDPIPVGNVTLYSQPGFSNPVAVNTTDGGAVMVIDYPVCQGQQQWFKVFYHGVVGWLPEIGSDGISIFRPAMWGPWGDYGNVLYTTGGKFYLSWFPTYNGDQGEIRLIPNTDTLKALLLDQYVTNASNDISGKIIGQPVPDIDANPEGYCSFIKQIQEYEQEAFRCWNGHLIPISASLSHQPNLIVGEWKGNVTWWYSPGNNNNNRYVGEMDFDIAKQQDGRFMLTYHPGVYYGPSSSEITNQITGSRVCFKGMRHPTEGSCVELTNNGELNYSHTIDGSETAKGVLHRVGSPPTQPAPAIQATQTPQPTPLPVQGRSGTNIVPTPVPQDNPAPARPWWCSYFGVFCPTTANLSRNPATQPFPNGQCTWYVATKRPDVWLWVKPYGADAQTWPASANSHGVPTSVGINSAQPGDIVVFMPGSFSWVDPRGHVAYVESVDITNNKIHISEYNGVNSLAYGERNVKVVDGMIFIHQYPKGY